MPKYELAKNMTECSACGTDIGAHEIHCPTCGKLTPDYHRQRRCLHCGMPAAERAKTCLMCGKPVDSIPLSTSTFGGSWLGIGLGLLIILSIVAGVVRYQWGADRTVRAAQSGSPTPTVTSTPSVTHTPNPTGTPTATETQTPTATPTPRRHVVQAGENPSFIADLYGVSVEELIALNSIEDVGGLRVGQQLVVPASANAAVDPAADALRNTNRVPQIVYIIESGDTLLGIALEYGTTTDAIVAVNPNIDLDLIFPGQSIVVPLSSPTPTPSPTVTPTATPTPGPLYPPPDLLSPTDNEVVTDSTLLFTWLATGLLADNEYYVLQLEWPDGTSTEHWVKHSSWRIAKAQRPVAGLISWRVAIMRQTGEAPNGSPLGDIVTAPLEQRAVEWP